MLKGDSAWVVGEGGGSGGGVGGAVDGPKVYTNPYLRIVILIELHQCAGYAPIYVLIK